MTLLEAILLGAVQGATEFLPISSSGHLKLGQALMGIQEPQLLFDIILHVGTLLSVMVFYRRDIAMVLGDGLEGLRRATRQRSVSELVAPKGVRLALLVVLATLPTGVIGVLLESVIEPEGRPSPITAPVVCGILLINGVILMTNAYFLRQERRRRAEEAPARQGTFTLWSITPAVALAIGVVQGIAVLPGLSRSGLTITLALALSVQRLHAARYSFLLSIPAILGALVLKFDPTIFTASSSTLIFGVGALVAAGVGYGCLILLTHMLERARFHHFAWYCWIVGVTGLVVWGI